MGLEINNGAVSSWTSVSMSIPSAPRTGSATVRIVGRRMPGQTNLAPKFSVTLRELDGGSLGDGFKVDLFGFGTLAEVSEPIQAHSAIVFAADDTYLGSVTGGGWPEPIPPGDDPAVVAWLIEITASASSNEILINAGGVKSSIAMDRVPSVGGHILVELNGEGYYANGCAPAIDSLTIESGAGASMFWTRFIHSYEAP